MTDIKQEVVGKWPGIFSSLGVDVGTGKHKPCPVPGCAGTDRFRFTNENGDGGFYCNQCEPHAGDGWALLMKVLNINFKEAVKAVEDVIGGAVKTPINDSLQYNPERLRQLYKDSKPLTGNCMGSMYLKNRGLKTFPKTLRYLSNCYEPSTKTKMPAILATVSAPDSEALSLHRTYLKNGYKSDIKKCKLMMTPKKPLAGSAVRLFPATNQIGITEGIETAVAVHELFDIPVWAALSTSLLQAFEPPKGIENITIFADADNNYAGEKAAYNLANRLYLAGYAVGVRLPGKRGTDFLDVLNYTENKEKQP